MNRLVPALCLAALTGAPALAQSLVTNGSFEDGPPMPGAGYLPVNPSSGILPGWSVIIDQIDIVGAGLLTPSDGSRFLDLNGSPGSGGVRQTVPTTPGEDYVVLFDLWRNIQGNLPTATMKVEAANTVQDYVSTGNDNWTARAFLFTATDAAHDVDLYSDVPVSNAGPMIDRVEVHPSVGSSFCTPTANSTGYTARMFAIGSSDVSDDTLSLVAVDMPKQQFGYFLVSQSTANVPGVGSGVLCLGGSIGRFNQQIQWSGVFGTVRIDVDLNDLPQPTGNVAVQPGETWHFQLWHRDNDPGPTSNLSDAVSVTFS